MKENFGDKINTGGFHKNPQNINRSGANRKSFSSINEVLKKKGIQPVKKNELIEFYTLIFNATEDELIKIYQDKKTPLALKIVLMELKDKSTRSKAIADLRNYMFGQAMQEHNHTIKARVLTHDEMREHLKKLDEDY